MLNLQEIENLLKDKIYNLVTEKYNKEYDAHLFQTSSHTYRYRLAKITPTKAGAFVVIWHKNELNTNIPFNYEHFPDNLIVHVVDNKFKGYFIFPKDILMNKGILTFGSNKGKMGFRVYAPWVSELNKTAERTKQWQDEFFYRILE